MRSKQRRVKRASLPTDRLTDKQLQRLVTRLIALAQIIVAVFRQHGFRLNFKLDKTQAFLHLQGHGSEALKLQLFAADVPALALNTVEGPKQLALCAE